MSLFSLVTRLPCNCCCDECIKTSLKGLSAIVVGFQTTDLSSSVHNFNVSLSFLSYLISLLKIKSLIITNVGIEKDRRPIDLMFSLARTLTIHNVNVFTLEFSLKNFIFLYTDRLSNTFAPGFLVSFIFPRKGQISVY